MPLRQPAVADLFYPADPGELSRELRELFTPGSGKHSPERAIGVLAPHAGYVYSGRTAASVYARVRVPPTAIILGPNHTGTGPAVSLFPEGEWRLPAGPVSIDRELAAKIASLSSLVSPDARAHQREHSLEVQVPFLQYREPAVAIVPISLGPLSYSECEELGQALARALKELDPRPLIVASSDMTHYEAQKEAERKDRMAIEKILRLEPRGLLQTVEDNDISMCGVIPAVTMLIAARALGARKAELTAYTTSAEVSRDYLRVVGYAGMIIV